MVEFVLNLNDSKTGKSYKKEISGNQADFFLNKKLDETIKGDTFDFKNYEFKITGGSDKEGFPMRKDVYVERKKPLLVSGVGAKTKGKGIKQKKTVVGNLINEKIRQINLKIEKIGSKKIEELIIGSDKPKEDLKEPIQESPKEDTPNKKVEKVEETKDGSKESTEEK